MFLDSGGGQVCRGRCALHVLVKQSPPRFLHTPQKVIQHPSRGPQAAAGQMLLSAVLVVLTGSPLSAVLTAHPLCFAMEARSVVPVGHTGASM